MFTTHRALLEDALCRLSVTPTEAPWAPYALEGIAHMVRRAEVYDVAVRFDSPFREHFLNFLTSPSPDDEGHWIALFEDLILFIREKTLRPPHRGFEPVEHKLLSHFELCGEWEPFDGTLISEWYWQRLPLMISQELTN